MIHPIKFRISKNSSNQYRVSLINKIEQTKKLQKFYIQKEGVLIPKIKPIPDPLYKDLIEVDQVNQAYTQVKQSTIAKSKEYIDEMKLFRQTLNSISTCTAKEFANSLKKSKPSLAKIANDLPVTQRDIPRPIVNKSINEYLNNKLASDAQSAQTDPAQFELPPITESKFYLNSLVTERRIKKPTTLGNSPKNMSTGMKTFYPKVVISSSIKPRVESTENANSSSSFNIKKKQLKHIDENTFKVLCVYGGFKKLKKNYRNIMESLKGQKTLSFFNKSEYNN